MTTIGRCSALIVWPVSTTWNSMRSSSDLDVMEEAAAQERVRQLLLVVGRDDDNRPLLRPDRLAGLDDVELHAVEFRSGCNGRSSGAGTRPAAPSRCWT